MMLLANNLENEVKSQKNKMKEMEDYLDNLLLRVMETHPKILQNPYRTKSSVKRYFTRIFWHILFNWIDIFQFGVSSNLLK